MTSTVETRGSRLIVDPSALLCRYLPDRRQAFVNDAMAAANELVVTALARTEVELGLHQALGAAGSAGPDDPTTRFHNDWDRFWVVPVDDRCLRRAADLGRIYGLNLVNSLHLAAMEPIPKPATLLTVDDRQFAAASDFGFEVAEPQSGGGSADGLLIAE